jgi:hypothetical protein
MAPNSMPIGLPGMMPPEVLYMNVTKYALAPMVLVVVGRLHPDYKRAPIIL